MGFCKFPRPYLVVVGIASLIGINSGLIGGWLGKMIFITTNDTPAMNSDG